MPLDVEDLYRRFGPMVLRRCRRMLGDEASAVDAMHDVFVEILRRRDRLETASPSSYLWTTATRTCLNRIRSRRRRPETPGGDVLERIAQAPESDLAGARVLLDRVLGREAPSTRTLAVLHLLDGLTLAEVAAESGLSVSGVRKRLRTLKAHVAELEGA
ncbi:MAG: sigma-70 family RNA polymerase sigma factor [Deltaproteobacteria bacterium]|nr:sigma-70 family RNA polymerase sigma factor [Deltaproteobacteria bacterium]